MSTPNTNPLSFNAYVQQIAAMAVVLAQETSGVWGFVDAPMQTILPQMLSYAENRINRDLDVLQSQCSKTYTLTAGANVLQLPVDDFFTVTNMEIVYQSNSQTVNASPLLPVSREFIQNCYGGLAASGTPGYFAMIGDNFSSPGQDTNMNILLGPPPNFAYTVRVTGTAVMPSLFKYAVTGVADTQFTYLSSYYSDMLIMASMIYVSAFQRGFSSTSADVEMAMSYEKQYQALRLGAIPEEGRRKQMGSAWSGYSTPTAATPTR